MRRWRGYIAVGCIVVPGLLAAVALAGPGRAIDWTSVAPVSAAARERANRQAAGRDAARLLARVVLPAGAAQATADPTPERGLSQPGLIPAGVELIDRHGWWTVAEPLSAVDSFMRARVPPGAHLYGYGSGGQPPAASVTFAFPPVGRVLGSRWLVVSMVALSSDTTALRVDGEVQWIIPRPIAERIPRSVRVLEVTVGAPGRAPSTRTIVVNRAKVWRIAAQINGLETIQPEDINCPAWSIDAPVVTFTFRRDLDGPVVARASELAAAIEPTTPCDPMTLSIGGHRWTPLLGGAAVVRAAQRLIGVRLVPR